MTAPNDKTQAILSAALQVFAQQGFEKARVEDIAHAAGVGKGTVYQYFSSKREIFEQAIVQGTAQYLFNLERELHGVRAAEEKLRRVACRHFHFMVQNQDLARIVTSSPELISPYLKEKLLEIRQDIEDKVALTIAEGIKEGHLRPLDAHLAARAFLGGLSSVAATYFFEGQSWEPESTANKVCDIFLCGLRATARPTASRLIKAGGQQK